MNQICIYTETPHPRLAYVIRFIQQFLPDNELVCYNTLTAYQSFQGISINYSTRKIKDQEYFIFFSGWLYSELHRYEKISNRNYGEQFQLFPNEADDEFDLFAAIFYIITRIEEYFPFDKDAHDRFPANQSILYKNQVLSIPIVDIWLIHLIQSLETKFDLSIKTKKCKPSWSLGIDIDQFYKYKHKSVYRNIGGLIKSLATGQFRNFAHRIRVLCLNYKDPFDSYEQIEKLQIDKEQLIFFILSGGSSSFDKNHPLHLKHIQKIIKRLDAFSKIALHPSYASTHGMINLIQEKKNLDECLGHSVEISRQHFLKLRFPESYRQLIALGIKKEYSLGYADMPGFRAGTGRSFYWYDLEQEVETDLLIVPLITMDRTYLDYLKYSPEASEDAIKKLFDTCISAGGHFHLVWHNSSYDFEDEWKNWEGVLESLIQYFKINGDNNNHLK